MIKELIDKFYDAKQEKGDKLAFYVSDAGKCPRAIWFSVKGYPKKEFDARMQRVFEHGNHTHMRIMGVLFSLGLVNAVEVDIPRNEMIHGRADAIISINNEPYVVEVKSVNSIKFKKDYPDADHINQLQLYLYFFNIKKGILLYENKDTQDLKEFVLDYDEALVKRLFAGFNELKKQVEENIVPAIPEEIEDWRCAYCSYLDECAKIEEKHDAKQMVLTKEPQLANTEQDNARSKGQTIL